MKQISNLKSLLSQTNSFVDSPEFMAMSEANQEIYINDHDFLIKYESEAEKNRKEFQRKFGIYFTDDYITAEEISALSKLEEEIAHQVEADMKAYVNSVPEKRTATKSKGNMNHLFA